RYAAMGGCRTLLIEKRQEIGSPVRCGEGLARHFVEDTKLPFDQKWVGREVKGAKIFSPNGTELTIEEAHAGNEVGIVLERDAFDKAVAKEAAKEGADIWLKTTATAVIKDDGWVRGIRAKRLEEEMNIEAKCIDVHLLFEAFRADPADPAVVLDDRRRGGLEPDVCALLRGLLRNRLIERVPLEDDSDLVAGVGFLDRQLGAIRREDLRALDLPSDPLLVERQFRIFDEVTRKTLATTHRRANLLPFLDQDGAT